MTARLLRTIVTLAVSALLVVAALATAGSAAAAIPDRTFQVLGCEVGDYGCFYAKLGGAPHASYCQNGNYSCTNGIPDGGQQPATGLPVYCGDSGGKGCVNGSPLFVSVNTSVSTANGTSSAVIISSGFVGAGPDGRPVNNP